MAAKIKVFLLMVLPFVRNKFSYYRRVSLCFFYFSIVINFLSLFFDRNVDDDVLLFQARSLNPVKIG